MKKFTRLLIFIRRRINKKYCYILLFSSIICFSLSMLFIINSSANEDNNVVLYKYYTSVEVSYGNTLEGLADQYNSVGYESDSTYMKEVKRINHISNADKIYEGQIIVFPYYSPELK